MQEKTHFSKPLIEAIDGLQRFRVRKAQCVRSKPYDVSILKVQFDLCSFRASIVNVPEPPPVCQRRQKRAWVLVQSVVKAITDEIGHNCHSKDHRPVPQENVYERLI